MKATRLTEMVERFEKNMEASRDYAAKVAGIRGEIQIVESEISQIALDVDGLPGQLADLEDFLEWKRKLEERLGDCREISSKITDVKMELLSDEYEWLVLDSDAVLVWLMRSLLRIIHELIDYFAYILMEDFHGERTQVVRIPRPRAGMIDESGDARETVTTDEVAERFLKLHSLADEIEYETRNWRRDLGWRAGRCEKK